MNKPRGPTSHDVVAAARRLLCTRAVGHAGTLDPMASGVLLLLLGEATKLSAYLSAQDKEYRATVSFGVATTTDDAWGEVRRCEELGPGWLAGSRLEAALDAERSRVAQVPPEFSAVKVSGRPAHRRARRGEKVELAARPVQVHKLVACDASERAISFELVVSKGYYVRSFARDLGEHLGVPAHLSELVRTRSGPFPLDEAVSWPPSEPVTPIPLASAALRALPSARLTQEGARRAVRGQRLSPADFAGRPPDAPLVAWLAETGRLVALGSGSPETGYVVTRGFAEPIITRND